MRKIIVTIFTILSLSLPLLAEEVDWSKYDNIDNAWDGQKIVPNKQYEETMKALDEKKNAKDNKAKAKALKKLKGNSLHSNLDPNLKHLESQNPLEEAEECQILNIPVDFIHNGKAIEKGFYKIVGVKDDDGVYFELFQAYDLVAKIKAKETKDDFDEQYIQFVKLIPHNDNYMKIIFGCLDFNAFAYLPIINSQDYNQQ